MENDYISPPSSLNDEDMQIWRLAIEQGRQSGQYDDFLLQTLLGIPLLSLWNICSIVAMDMLHDYNIPDCITNLDRELLNEAAETELNENTVILLKPVQQWLSEQIVTSINKKEISPQVIGRFFDGAVDSKRTYIDIEQIGNWLLSRRLNAIESDNLGKYIDNSLERLVDFIMNESALLQLKIYDPNYKNPVENKEFGHLYFENARLQLQLNNIVNRKLHYRVSPNGHEERYAKNREQVLGAALAVITQWTDQCKNSSGKFEATKIAKLIDEKSLLFWAETGEPPLSLGSMEREIGKWINKTGK
jgi:hypothetical protein